MNLNPFHLAIQVRNLDESREFYSNVLGCTEGRSDRTWIDFNLYGHQLVCHLNPHIGPGGSIDLHHNAVDGHSVPVPHFGVVLDMCSWNGLAQRLQKTKTPFVIEPQLRFHGKPGEQAIMFLLDPSGNALEFKAFRSIENQLFAKNG